MYTNRGNHFWNISKMPTILDTDIDTATDIDIFFIVSSGVYKCKIHI